MPIDGPNEITPETESASIVWPPPPTGPSFEPLPPPPPEFKQQNVLFLLVLYVVTLGFYGLFWMHRQIRTINARVSPPPISGAAFWICATLIIADMVRAFSSARGQGSDAMDLLVSLAWLFMAFMIRRGLNLVFGARSGDRHFCQTVWTFFFSLFYLQHKINRYLRDNVGSLLAPR